jgi:hypothetical protein
MSALEKVRRLISLSASPNEHEARSAAFHACRMIREHGFEVVAPTSDVDHVTVTVTVKSQPAAPPARDPEVAWTRRPLARDLWEQWVRPAARSTRCSACRKPIRKGEEYASFGNKVAGQCMGCFRLAFVLDET